MPTLAAPETTALAVALESESLEALYLAWLEQRLRWLGERTAREKELAALEVKAEYLLKTVAAARRLPGGAKAKPRSKAALAKADPLAQFQAQAQAEVKAGMRALKARGAREEKAAAAVDARVRKALQRRADLHLAVHQPRLELQVHPVGKDHVMVEVAAFGDEDAVLLLRVLHGRLPTRWGYFADDAVEDLQRGPARLYPDDGVTELWPADADAEDASLFGKREFVPARGQLPSALPRRAFPRYRFAHHGPIAQLEARRKGEPYTHLVRREDAELLTGFLLRLKLAGKLQLELDVG